MDHLRDNDGTALGYFSLGTLQNLVQDCAAVHVPLREYAGHWVVPLDDMPEGGGDALEIAAVALLVSAQDPDDPLAGDEAAGTLGSLSTYSLGPCAEQPEICWRLDHLTLRVHRVH
jgi:hypothetical protein